MALQFKTKRGLLVEANPKQFMYKQLNPRRSEEFSSELCQV